MRSYILMAFVTFITFVSAIPITPAAPRWQKKAEQFRLQGMREFDIAERLTTPTPASPSTDAEPFLSRLERNLHVLIHSSSSDDDYDFDLSGDIAPGSAESPQMLPQASVEDEASFFEKLCALFHRSESDFGYEGKESEMRRPTGMVHWKQNFGGFRR